MTTIKQVYEKVKETGQITEQQINPLKRRVNNGGDVEYLGQIVGIEPAVTNEQAQKGFAWLWGKYKKMNGDFRKNNPFGQREADVLDLSAKNGYVFYFKGFHHTGYGQFAYPVYRLVSGDTGFSYCVIGGDVNII